MKSKFTTRMHVFKLFLNSIADEEHLWLKQAGA